MHNNFHPLYMKSNKTIAAEIISYMIKIKTVN